MHIDLMLRAAVLDGNLEEVRHYLEMGCSPNQHGSGNGDTLLQYALYTGNIDICKELLNAEAACYSSVEKAIIENSYSNLKLAIGDSNEYFQTAVIGLITTSQCDILRMLLVDYVYDINFRNGNYTPFHLAIKFNDFSIVELLLEKGSEPSFENGAGENALDFAYKIATNNKESEEAYRIYSLIFENTCYL